MYQQRRSDYQQLLLFVAIFRTPQQTRLSVVKLNIMRLHFKGGGGSKPFFWRIYFEHRALQVPLVIGGTFGEDLGPRRPTSSKQRPAQLLRPK